MRFTPAPSLLALALLAPAPAAAQSPSAPPPSAADRATARALAQEGLAALGHKDFAAAADRFARADATVHAPTFLIKLAEAQAGLGQLLNALETCSRIRREGLGPDAPSPFVQAHEDAGKALAALQARLGAKRAVDPGKHVIRAAAPGFRAKEASVTVAERAVQLVPLALDEPGPAEAIPEAPSAPPAGSVRRPLGIAGLAAGGVGLAVGSVLGGLAIAKHGEIAPNCQDGVCPSSYKASIATYYQYSRVSAASFIAGGALAVTGLVLVVTAPRPKPGVSVAPVLAPGWAGVEGRF
jgi:hypothetical protein